MRFFYNIIQVLAAPFGLLFLIIILIRRPEKWKSLPSRLGLGLTCPNRRGKMIWIHALSVGEVTSALPLVRALRHDFPEHTLIFSTTTASGRTRAENLICPFVDSLIAFPLDILPVVKHFIKIIEPDLFILIETDFWPNLIGELGRAEIPAVLVNGRISASSMRMYRRFKSIFRPLFNQFRLLCMQTAEDASAMRQLGLADEKLLVLGNLKYAATTEEYTTRHVAKDLINLPPDSLLLLCGSTHPGEEHLILTAFSRLRNRHANLLLAIAPRRIERCAEIIELAEQHGFAGVFFSLNGISSAPVTIIDTIGDLAALYRYADIAFIGGSMVAEGGHNPLEAARLGRAIVFGTSMDDFSEISSDLLTHKGAFSVADGHDLEQTLERLINSSELRQETGLNARHCIDNHLDVLASHVRTITSLL